MRILRRRLSLRHMESDRKCPLGIGKIRQTLYAKRAVLLTTRSFIFDQEGHGGEVRGIYRLICPAYIRYGGHVSPYTQMIIDPIDTMGGHHRHGRSGCYATHDETIHQRFDNMKNQCI